MILTLSATNYQLYKVEKGDTLRSIARKLYGDEKKWQDIAELNEIKNPDSIKAGQEIKVPDEPFITSKKTQPKKEVQKDQVSQETEETHEYIKLLIHFFTEADAKTYAGLAVILYLISCIIHALFLKGGCWFSLVEADILQCVKLSLLLSFILIVVFSSVGFGCYKYQQHATIFIIVGTVAAYAFSILLTKKILDCKWRSVVTVHVMTFIVSYSSMALISMALITALGYKMS